MSRTRHLYESQLRLQFPVCEPPVLPWLQRARDTLANGPVTLHYFPDSGEYSYYPLPPMPNFSDVVDLSDTFFCLKQ